MFSRLATKSRFSHCVPKSGRKLWSRPLRLSTKVRHLQCVPSSRNTSPPPALRLSYCVPLSSSTPSLSRPGLQKPKPPPVQDPMQVDTKESLEIAFHAMSTAETLSANEPQQSVLVAALVPANSDTSVVA